MLVPGGSLSVNFGCHLQKRRQKWVPISNVDVPQIFSKYLEQSKNMIGIFQILLFGPISLRRFIFYILAHPRVLVQEDYIFLFLVTVVMGLYRDKNIKFPH